MNKLTTAETTNFILYLSIFGESFIPSRITRLINLQPSNTWFKGDLNTLHPNRPARHETLWEYSLGKKNTLFFDEDVSELFCDLFENRLFEIRKFVDEHNLIVKVTVILEIINGAIPSLYLNRRFLSILEKLSAELEFDSYILPLAEIENKGVSS